MSSMQIATIPDVIAQFSDNCASLWNRRENLARSFVGLSTISDLERTDQRLDAQIDGLRTGETEGWISASAGLESQDGGNYFTAALLAFDPGFKAPPQGKRVDLLLESIKKAHAAVRPISLALDWCDTALLPSIAAELSRRTGPLAEAMFIVARCLQGDIPIERSLKALESQSPFVVCTACSMAAGTHERLLLRPIEARMNDADVEISLAAATAALSLGSSRAADILTRMAADRKLPEAEIAASHLFRSIGPRQALSLHRELFFAGKPNRAAVIAAGASGIPELVPFLIHTLGMPPLARLAGEALSEIVGIDIEREQLDGEAPETQNGGPSEDPADENTDLDKDEGKPWPDPAGVENWWRTHSFTFNSQTRYLAGSIVCNDSLNQLLRGGKQTLRASAAEHLALAGKPLFDIYAPAFRQAQRLGMEGGWR